MSVLKRFTSWVCVIGALALIAWPADADAQRRRGRRRVIRPAIYSSYGYGPGFGFYNPYFYGPSAVGPWGPYPYGVRYEGRGSIRLQVKPEETEVYVDGYYAGVVDSYDGFFQRLHLPPGEHEIELYLEGHRSIQEQLYLPVGSTYHIRHEMEPLGPGVKRPSRTRCHLCSRRWKRRCLCARPLAVVEPRRPSARRCPASERWRSVCSLATR